MSSTPADIVREAAEKDSKAAVEVRSIGCTRSGIN